jgi:hypothetical protein
MLEQEDTPMLPGKPWKNEGYYPTFEQADAVRQKLTRIWNANAQHKGMQVKVKWSKSKNSFVVKTRLHPDFEPKKEEKVKKKSGKNSRRNRQNSSGRKYDPNAVV